MYQGLIPLCSTDPSNLRKTEGQYTGYYLIPNPFNADSALIEFQYGVSIPLSTYYLFIHKKQLPFV